MSTDNKTYHHGNLKETLVKSLIELLESEEIEKISLRKLASHVGVAPTAVYNHFKSKEELRVAAKVQCLAHFADYLDNSVVDIESPEARIRELGKAYFNYSLEWKPYFDLLMGENIPPEFVTEEVLETSMRAEAALRGAVSDLLTKHGLPANQYNEGLGAFACWSMTHGITTLAAKHVNHAACLQERWPPEFMLCDHEQIHASYDAMSDVLIHGLLATARK